MMLRLQIIMDIEFLAKNLLNIQKQLHIYFANKVFL